MKKVGIFPLLFFGIIGVVFHLIFHNFTITELLGGMLIGLLLMLLSIISKESIGMGDGLLLMITGVYLGGRENLKLFFIGNFILGMCALFLLVICKKSKKYKIAFIPCLLIAYIYICAGG